jgi:hypothetical protein
VHIQILNIRQNVFEEKVKQKYSSRSNIRSSPICDRQECLLCLIMTRGIVRVMKFIVSSFLRMCGNAFSLVQGHRLTTPAMCQLSHRDKFLL